MDGRPPSKRKRIVTACTECHRRKQKCNRQKPCNICLARKVSSRCQYSDAPNTVQSNPTENGALNWTPETTLEDQPGALSGDHRDDRIVDQIGYSPISNVFMDLQQILKDEPRPTGRSTQPSLLEDKYWSIVAELPSPAVVNELVDVFFTHVNWYYSLVERHSFNELQKSWLNTCGFNDGPLKRVPMKDLPRDELHFPALIFQIKAIALEVLPSDASTPRLISIHNDTSRHRLSGHYSSKGMDLMDILGRYHATLTSIQQDLLRAVWLKVFGRGSESWHTLGSAVRQAQELNLHVQFRVDQSGSDIRETLNRLWYDEYKKRLWIVLFIWDSHMALVLDRPRIINANDCDIRMPLDCRIPEDPSKVVPTAVEEGGASPPSTISPIIFQYRISQLIHEMKTTGANKRFPRDYSVVQILHDKVISLLDGLPSSLRPINPDTSWDSRFPNILRQREQVVMAGNSFLLGLHRPHAHSNFQSRKAAMQAALTLLDSAQRFFDKTPKNQYRFFGLAFFTIDAGFLLSTLATLYPPTDQNIKQQVELSLLQGMSRLEILESVNAIAGSGLKMLRYCYQKMRLASTSCNGVPISLETVEIVVEGSEQQGIIVSGTTGTTSQTLEREDNQLAASTSFDAIPQPADPLHGEFADVNEFDVSYWIEQMNSISQFPMDDLNNGISWNAPLG